MELVALYGIYTIILQSICQCSQTAGRNSCSIVSGDISNCSYRLTVHPVTSSRLSSTYHFCIREFFLINYRVDRPSRIWLLNGPAAPLTMRSWLNGRRPHGAARTTAVILRRDRLIQNSETTSRKGRQREFIPSRLEQCGLGIITWPMRCSVCKNQQ